MTINIRMAHLFSGLDDDQLRQVSETSHIIPLQDGQTLFEMGEEAKRFFLVAGGQVKLFRVSANGDEKIIDIIQMGNTFAEALMFMSHPTYPVSAQALGPARVMSFDSACFLRILGESPQTCFRIMGTMSQRLRGLIKEIDDLTLRSATARLCAMLLSQADRTQSDRFVLPAAKGVLAARLSMKPETFSRIFHTLSTNGVIEVGGNEVIVRNPDQLRCLAQTESFVGLEPDTPYINPCPDTGPRTVED